MSLPCKPNRKYGLSVFLMVLAILFSQAVDLRFYSLNDLYGISYKEAYSVCQDEKGFIWGATRTGILRISENDYRVYSLPHERTDFFSTRLTCNHSALIAYTGNGQVFIYNELYDRFDFLADLYKISGTNVIISKIVIDSEKNLWIATSIGLLKYAHGSLKPVSTLSAKLQYLALLKDNRLFYATENGFGFFDMETGLQEHLYSYKENKKSRVSSFLYEEHSGLLWIGTISHGIFCYDIKENILSEVPVDNPPEQPVLVLRKNTDSTFLAGIDGQGVWEFSIDGKKVLNIYKEDANNPYSLHGNGVYDIFCDADGKVWIATYTGGLSYYYQKQLSVNHITHHINNSNSLANNYVNKTLEDRNGNLWFATNNGVSRWDVSADRWYTFFQNKQAGGAGVFLGLCEDDDGNIWAGSYSSGVYVIDKKGEIIKHHFFDKDEHESSVKFVIDIFKDSQGNIWIAGTTQLVCYLKRENRFRVYDPKPIRSIEELSSDKMLIACNYGLLTLDKNTGKYETLFGNCFVQDVVVIGHELWVGSSGEGLIQYDYEKKTLKKYTVEAGLLSNYINSLIYDNCFLWIGTENGLCLFDVENKQAYTYSAASLFSSFSFTVSSCIKLNKGELAWGTNKGAVIFNPSSLFNEEIQGEIFFQDIVVSGSSIRHNEKLLKETPINLQTQLGLNYDENNFMLELLPIGAHTAGCKFSWKLEGLELDWNKPSSLPFITYTNLPNGRFTLQIRMYESSLSTIIDERSLSINIIPPFWETGWFRVMILLLFIGFVFYSLKTYSNHLKQRHAREKIRFFTNMAHDLRNALTLINAPVEELNKAQELSDKSRYFLGLAREQSEKLTSVTNQLLDFQKIDTKEERLFLKELDIVKLVNLRIRMFDTLAKSRNIDLRYYTDKDSYLTAVDEIKIEKVIDNLLSNAVKYSNKDSQIDISFTGRKKEWSLEVKDYGIGISEEAKSKLFREFYRGENVVNSKIIGSGIGLLLIKDYVKMHGGKVIINSKENEGASFKIVIPYKESGNVMQIVEEKNSVLNISIDEIEMTLSNTRKEKKPVLLVVEDNDVLCHFLSVSFGEQFQILTANDGVEAWDIINKKLPDLVISDIMMPNRDGFELCKLIKSTFKTSHLPVILLTSLSEKTKQLEGFGWGADDYITKPFDMALLLQRIKSIIKNREMVRKNIMKLINHSDNEQPVLENSLNDRFIKKALQCVQKNMSDTEFGKDEFASSMNVSSSLLYQKIKALTGQSPIDFIKTIRLNYALELLESRQYSIVELSEMCGFSSANYFSTVFKKHFGKSPLGILNE